jgi:hypothetical protein
LKNIPSGNLGIGWYLKKHFYILHWSLVKGHQSFRPINAAKRIQGCQIFLGTWYQTRKKCTKWIQNVQNCRKISQISIKYSKWP